MVFKDLLDLVTNEKRNKKRLKSAQISGVGIGIVATVGIAAFIYCCSKCGKENMKKIEKKVVKTIETVNDDIHNKVDEVTDAQIHDVHAAYNTIHDVCKKNEEVKKDIKDGCQKIIKDTHKTAENIVNELNKSEK